MKSQLYPVFFGIWNNRFYKTFVILPLLFFGNAFVYVNKVVYIESGNLCFAALFNITCRRKSANIRHKIHSIFNAIAHHPLFVQSGQAKGIKITFMHLYPEYILQSYNLCYSLKSASKSRIFASIFSAFSIIPIV